MFIILKAGWNVSLYFKTLVVLFESLMLSSPNPDSARQIFSSPQYTILSHDVLQNYYTITYQMTALCVMMRYYTWSSSRPVFKIFTHATLPQLQITTTWSMQLRAIFEQLTVEVVENPFVNGFNAPTQIRAQIRERRYTSLLEGMHGLWQTDYIQMEFLQLFAPLVQSGKLQCQTCLSVDYPSTGLDSRQTNAQPDQCNAMNNATCARQRECRQLD